MFDQGELDTSLVARKTLHFMRSNGLTVTEFSEKVSFISHYLFWIYLILLYLNYEFPCSQVILGKRKMVSDYLHQPSSWQNCNHVQVTIWHISLPYIFFSILILRYPGGFSSSIFNLMMKCHIHIFLISRTWSLFNILPIFSAKLIYQWQSGYVCPSQRESLNFLKGFSRNNWSWRAALIVAYYIKIMQGQKEPRQKLLNKSE